VPPKEFENDKDESAVVIAKGFKTMFQKHPKFNELWKKLTSKKNDRNSKGKFVSKIKITKTLVMIADFQVT